MKSQPITPEIKKALWQWYQESKKSQPEIAKILGLQNHSSVNQWLNGRSKMIRPKNWETLYPHLKPYLPENFSQTEIPPPPADQQEPDAIFVELKKLWPQLSLSEKANVLSYTAGLLEKSGGRLQSPILEKVN